MRHLPLLALLLAAPVLADEDPFRQADGLNDATSHTRPQVLSGFIGLPFSYGFAGFFPFGLSGRYTIPLAHDGFVPQLNDEVDLDVGADFALFSGAGRPFFWFGVPVEAMWQLHFVPRFSAYLKLGVVLGFATAGAPGVVATSFFYSPIGALGLNFKLTQSLVLRFEVGYPWAKLGLGVMF